MKTPFLFFVCCALVACVSQPPKKPETVVSVLGSIHGNMLDQPRHGLKDFISALQQFRPTLILTEARPEFPDVVNATIDGGAEQSLIHAFARTSGIKIVPVDWFDDDYNLQSAREDARMSKAVKKEIAPLLASFVSVVRTGSLLDAQSAETQDLIRKRYDILEKHGLASLRRRDAAICKRIKAQNLEGQRVLIVFGLAHKYYLEDCVREAGVTPTPVQSWYDPARPAVITKAFKDDALRTLHTAQFQLGSRLQKGQYRTDLENLRDKLKEFETWIAKTRELRLN